MRRAPRGVGFPAPLRCALPAHEAAPVPSSRHPRTAPPPVELNSLRGNPSPARVARLARTSRRGSVRGGELWGVLGADRATAWWWVRRAPRGVGFPAPLRRRVPAHAAASVPPAPTDRQPRRGGGRRGLSPGAREACREGEAPPRPQRGRAGLELAAGEPQPRASRSAGARLSTRSGRGRVALVRNEALRSQLHCRVSYH